MAQLVLLAIGKDAAETDACAVNLLRWIKVDYHIIVRYNRDRLPLSVLANRYLEPLQRGDFYRPPEVFGLCHADAVFHTGALDAFVDCAASGSVCGIVGARLDGSYACASEVKAVEPVSTLDGMAVFFRPDSGLRFDRDTFDGMHCHVEDLCLQAAARGIPVLVPPANAHHTNHQQSEAWLRDYRYYRQKLADKWAGREFRTT